MIEYDPDLEDFFKMFEIQINEETNISRWRYDRLINTIATKTATGPIEFTTETIPALQLTISVRQLERLVKILKSKGYFHDDDYQIKLQEEELILANLTLKHYHDQYKTLLYMLNDRDYDQKLD